MVISLLLLVPLAAFVIWYFRLRRKPAEGLIASEHHNPGFDNPYFNQEITMSHLQVRKRLFARTLLI